MSTKQAWARTLAAVLLLGLAMPGTGCLHEEGWFEETGEELDDAADDLGDSVEEAADEAEDELD